MGVAPVGSDGTWAFSAPVTEPGPHEIGLNTLDPEGQVVAAAPPISLSVAAPPVEVALPAFIFPANEADVLEGELTLIGTGEPDSDIEVWDNETVVGTAPVGVEGEWYFTLEPGRGTHRYAASPAGSEAGRSEVVNVRVVSPLAQHNCASNAGLDRGIPTLSVPAIQWGPSWNEPEPALNRCLLQIHNSRTRT